MRDSNGKYELIILPRGRNPADEYPHNGATWIEGRDGSNYVIEIKNNTHVDVAAIVSVDGLDVLEGKPAGLDSKGYIVNARSSVKIDGWRINNQQVAEFYFSRKQDSYVTQMGGSVVNTGVIGAMFFPRKSNPILSVDNLWHSYHETSLSGSQPKPRGPLYKGIQISASAAQTIQPQNSMGTGWGDIQASKITRVEFEKANPNQPDAILAVYYNSAKNLEKMGIVVRKKRDIAYQANPFPAMDVGCRPPPGWVNPTNK